MQTQNGTKSNLGVSGRLKPASHGRLKTGHFEEESIHLVASYTAPALWETYHGESSQNGTRRNDFYAA
jgi:hypothetical protein